MPLHHNSNPSSANDSTTRKRKPSERLHTQAQLLTALLGAVKSPANPALAKPLARLSDAWEQCEDVIEDYCALAQPGDGAPCPSALLRAILEQQQQQHAAGAFRGTMTTTTAIPFALETWAFQYAAWTPVDGARLEAAALDVEAATRAVAACLRGRRDGGAGKTWVNDVRSADGEDEDARSVRRVGAGVFVGCWCAEGMCTCAVDGW